MFGFKPSCFQQTTPQKRRNINTRRVSQSAREVTFELKENTIDVDIIPDWDGFIGHCQDLKMPILTTDAGITLLGMLTDSPTSFLYSIEISSEFNIKCYKQSSSIPVRNLINAYTSKLERFSQLKVVIDTVSSADT